MLVQVEDTGNVYELRYWKGKKTKSPKKRRKKNETKQNYTQKSNDYNAHETKTKIS